LTGTAKYSILACEHTIKVDIVSGVVLEKHPPGEV